MSDHSNPAVDGPAAPPDDKTVVPFPLKSLIKALADQMAEEDARDAHLAKLLKMKELMAVMPEGLSPLELIVQDEDGHMTKMAHYAARRGVLPGGFSEWELIDVYDTVPDYQLTISAIAAYAPRRCVEARRVSVARIAAERGDLPADFNRWDLLDETSGWTVAHLAAANGTLPKDFTDWELRDNINTTVAHVAAKYGNLPADFNQWRLTDGCGSTVAYEAAVHGHLPEGFTDWEAIRNGIPYRTPRPNEDYKR